MNAKRDITYEPHMLATWDQHHRKAYEPYYMMTVSGDLNMQMRLRPAIRKQRLRAGTRQEYSGDLHAP